MNLGVKRFIAISPFYISNTNDKVGIQNSSKIFIFEK